MFFTKRKLHQECIDLINDVSNFTNNKIGYQTIKYLPINFLNSSDYDAITDPEAIKTELSKTQFTIVDVVSEKPNSSIFSWIKNIFN